MFVYIVQEKVEIELAAVVCINDKIIFKCSQILEELFAAIVAPKVHVSITCAKAERERFDNKTGREGVGFSIDNRDSLIRYFVFV